MVDHFLLCNIKRHPFFVTDLFGANEEDLTIQLFGSAREILESAEQIGK